MSLGLQIKAIGVIKNVGLVPKAVCTSGIGNIMPASNTSGIVPVSNTGGIIPTNNTDAFLGA